MRGRILNGVTRPFLVVAAAAVLLTGACELNKADQSELVGPSETGSSVQLTALSDTVNADGVSTVDVELTLRDNSGGPISGRAVLFQLDAAGGGGTLLPKTGFTYVGPVQEGFVMATDSSGRAKVVYVAGTAPGTVATIFVRPYGIDAGVFSFSRSVQILQQ